jgi:hypothetical protein
MLPRGFRHREGSMPLSAVVITSHGAGTRWEGVIERVRRRGRRVEVSILLSDGSDGVARLDLHDWDWLELQAGDIVAVHRLGEGCFSA